MAYAFVQGTSGASSPLAYGSNVTSGNILVAASVAFAASLTVTISDTRGSTWTQGALFSNASDTTTTAIYWAIAAGSGANSVTFTWSTPGDIGELLVGEYSGAPGTMALDGSGGAGGTGNVSTPSITTADSDDLLLSYVWTQNALTATSPWVKDVTGASFGSILAHNPDVAAGSHAPNFTLTGPWDTVLIGLGSSGAGSPTTTGFIPHRMPFGV